MKLHNEDCIKQMQTMIDAGEQVDSIVTDPPYELGFMGKSWDSTGIAFQKETWELALQLLKPGGHLLAFGGSRTYHRMAVAIEDAGFEIRDQIMWLYGSGFPKSRNIGKDMEKRKVGGIKNLKKIGEKKGIRLETGTQGYSYSKEYVPGISMGGKQISGDIPVYEITNEYAGWGTALKPAHEPVVMARKPCEGTVADNVLKHGTGGINIDECRVALDLSKEPDTGDMYYLKKNKEYPNQDKSTSKIVGQEAKRVDITMKQGRFPANVIHDGSAEALAGFPDSKGCQPHKITSNIEKHEGWGTITQKSGEMVGYEGEGSAARFFYCAKVAKAERNRGVEHMPKKDKVFNGQSDTRSKDMKGVEQKFTTESASNHHPTVKPIELMKYLCRLVTPKGGTVLDPFMGSGSTGIACKDEGFSFIGIEKEEEYFVIAEQRIKSSAPLLDFI